MEFILEILAEIFLVLLFQYPGAFIRSMFTGFKKPVKEIIKQDPFLNGTIGMVAIGLLIVFIKFMIT